MRSIIRVRSQLDMIIKVPILLNKQTNKKRIIHQRSWRAKLTCTARTKECD